MLTPCFNSSGHLRPDSVVRLSAPDHISMLAIAASLTPAFVAPTGVVARVEGRTAGADMTLGRRQMATVAFGALFAGASSANAMGGDQSKIGVSRVAIPAKSQAQSEPAKNGPLDTSGWTQDGKCTSPLSCWKDYPGSNLREGTCGINKKCPPAIKTKAETLSPFGINEFRPGAPGQSGESYTNQGSRTAAPKAAPAPAAAPAP